MYYPALNVQSPVALALVNLGHHVSAEIVAFGAIAGLTTAILAMFFGFTRVFLAMARDGFLPKSLAKIHEKSYTPRRLIWSVAVVMSITAGFFPIAQIANLVNIGTLAAFIAVCLSVMILRKKKPTLRRPFKTPFGPLIPMIGILLCLYLMSSLPKVTWVSFAIWMVLGLLFYGMYGRKRLNRLSV
jgi:APA family basic amino acid/polyamine antiporter